MVRGVKAQTGSCRPLGVLRSDSRFVILVILIVVITTSVPPVFGYLSTPKDKWFSGIVYNVHDAAQYLSWMREAGNSLFAQNKLTSESNAPIFLNLHWWIPGRLGHILRLSLPSVYEGFRLFSIPLFIISLYLWCSELFPERSRRRFALLLTVFTSGLGWVWVLLKQVTGTLAFPLDVYVMMGNSFYTMMASPHLTFAAALTVLVLYLAIKGHRQQRFGYSLGAALLALFLGMGHIYDVVTVWTVLGVFGLLLMLRDGWSWQAFWRLALVVLVSAPSVLYWGWVSSSANPMWKQALSQYDSLQVFTPDPAHLLILLGLTFMVAVVTFDGVVHLRRQTDRQLFVKGWFGATLLLIYLPFRFRVMLLTGYQLPMAVLATWGLFGRILPWLQECLDKGHWRNLLSHERLGRWVPTLFLLAVLPTNVYLTAWRVVDLGRHDYPFYLYGDDIEAMHWLEENTSPDDVVLSSFTIGQYIPGLTGNRAFLSNSVMTLDSSRKEAMVRAFFDLATSDREREALLRQYNIHYLFYGPAERALGAFRPGESELFSLVFSSANTNVYVVQAR